MKPAIRTHAVLLLILTIISFLGLIHILYQVKTNFVDALNIDTSEFDMADLVFLAGHIFNLILYIYSIIFIYGHFHKFKLFKLLSISALVLAVISLFTLAGEKVMFDEIAREYRFGMEVSEVNVLCAAYLINIAFAMLMFVFLLKVFRTLELDSAGM